MSPFSNFFFLFFPNRENEMLTGEGGADEYFCIALGSTWYNALLLNASNSGVGNQSTKFGIEWYVLPIK